MKARTMAQRPPAARTQRPTPLQRPVRPARSSHEHQAEESGARFLRGESQLGRLLTPAPAAALHLPASVPQALPRQLRRRLERAFDADLAGLRLHADVSAAQAAETLGARAFTAGADIYFSRNAWSPESPLGMALIAHEVAHALQQTGRASHDGRLRLEPAAFGQSGVQRDPDGDQAIEQELGRRGAEWSLENYFKDLPGLEPAKDAKRCAAAIDKHMTAAPDDTEIQALGKKIKAAVDGQSLTDAATAVDGILGAIVDDDRSQPIKAMFFDAYKALNQDGKAAALVGKDAPAATASWSWSFYATQKSKDPALWLPQLLQSHPVAGQYFLRNIVAVARMDFYGGARGGLNLDMGMKFDEKMNKAVIEALTASPFASDERTAVALRALVLFDSVRLLPFNRLQADTKGIKSLIKRFLIKLDLIRKYTDPTFLPTLATQIKVDPEVMVICTAAGAAIAPVAERATAFWSKIIPLVTAVMPGGKADEDALRHAARLGDVLRKKLAGNKDFAGVEKRLIAILGTTMRLRGGVVPDPATQAANFSAAAGQVENLVNALDGALAAREKQIKLTDVPSAKEDAGDDPLSSDTISDDMAFGVVLFLLFALQTSLVQYEAPKASKDPDEQIKNQDMAVKALKATAYGFAHLGQLLGYQELRKAAEIAEFAEQAGLKKSYVALLGPFENAKATLQDFKHDFPAGDIADNALSGASFIQAVYALYYENFLKKLKAELNTPVPGGKTRESDYDPGKTAIVNNALTAAEADFHLPRKYRVPMESTVLYVRPADDGKVYDFVTRNHPMVVDLITRELKSNESAIAPGTIRSHQEGFVIWILPDVDQIIDKIKDVPGLDLLKKKDGKPLGKPSDYTNPMQWFDALGEAATGDAATRQQLADAIKAWMTKALSNLDDPLRRATNNERRKVGPLIAAQWEKLTKRFLDSPNSYFEAPRLAMRYMLTFTGNIQPVNDSEQRLQITALMLELAPVLARKLGETTAFGDLVQIPGTDRLDVILPLHAHIEGAAKLAAGGTIQSQAVPLDLAFPMFQVPARAEQLRLLAEQFKGTAESRKAERLMAASAASRMIYIPGRNHEVVAKKDDNDQDSSDFFMVEGVVYQLKKVYRDFSYQPELLSMASGIKWRGDDIAKPRLWVDGKERAATEATIPLLDIVRMVGEQRVEMTVTSADIGMLTELTFALDLNITLQNLETLASILEGYASFITLVIQAAFPEFATEIAAAEVAGSVIQFLGGPEFAMLRGALDTDAGGLFNQGLKKITDQFTLDALWDYMLFDIKPPVFDTLSQALELFGRMGLYKNRDNEKSKGSVRKVFGRLVRVAHELIEGFTGVHDHVSFPFRKVSLYVQGSPWLSLLLRFVANNLYRLEGMSARELGIEEATEMITEVQQLYLRFETVVKGLGSYELPEELVPLEDIIDMLVNFLFDHLPLKYRLAAKEVKSNTQPLFDWLEKKAAKALKDNGVDPNRIWRDYAASKINPYIQEAGTAVSHEIEGVLKKVPFLHDLATINVPELTAQFADREVEPAPKLESGVGLPLAAPNLPAGPGAPLGVGARHQAQTGFGHDFSHVRMHRSDAVDTSLRASGAHAATAGSHVYLDSGISTATPGGRDVLNHELAHVLQQTGSRPLGAAHADAPVRGGGHGGGWDFNPSAETQADRLAQSARSPAATPRSVTPAHGLQPSLFDVVTKLFVNLGDPSKLKENAAEMIKHVVKEKELGQAAPGLKEHFAEKLFDALKKPGEAGSIVSYASPFDAVGEALVAYVKTNRKADVESGMPHVLNAGLHKIEPKGKDVFWILVPGRVETALEEFFFGVTGVSVDVEFNTKEHVGPDEKKRSIIDPDKPFKSIKFNYVHLPMIGGGADVWTHVIDNTFPKAGPKRQSYQANSRLALNGLKPGPGIFTSGKTTSGGKALIFARKTRELIEAYVNPPPKGDLPGNSVPTWIEYTKRAPQTAATGGYGQIGLRLGLYKQAKDLNQQKGTDRASHHSVQYLLLEYLVNSKDRVKPFPHDLALYPSLKHKGGRIDVISPVPDGDSGIIVSANEDGRGDEMPTILLSVHTHTLGNVHISPKPDDVEGGHASQGSAIHGMFKGFLGDYVEVVTGKSVKPLEAIKKKAAGGIEGKDFDASDLKLAGGKTATREDMSTAIYLASCKTYTWMRDHMNTKLQAALDDQEVAYYNKLVETATDPKIYKDKQAQPGYIPGAIGADVLKDVKQKQIDVLQGKTFGFEEKHP